MTAAVVSAPTVVYDALASVSAGHGFKKAKYTIQEGSKVGDGFTSILYRVTITDEEKSGNLEKLVVMCKTTEADDAGRTLLHYFKSEETVYNRILPSMKAVASFTEPLPWPRCLYAQDNSSGRPCLVFEDLCEDGFLTASRAVVPDVQHFHLALSQLAKFHGAGMALQHLQPIVFKDIAKGLVMSYEDPAGMQKYEQFSNLIKSSLVMIEDRFSADGEVYGKIKALYSRMHEELASVAIVPEPAPGIALMHGDCHLNNFMFKYDKESKKVQACRLIDFQLSRAGNTAIDLVNLLLVGTDKPLRDAHWDELLRGYHAALQDTLKAAGISNPDTIYTWEQFMGCVQEATKFCLCICPLALHAMQTDEKAALELRDAMNEFHKSDDGKVNLPFNVDLSLSIKQRFGDVIQSVVDWGWL